MPKNSSAAALWTREAEARMMVSEEKDRDRSKRVPSPYRIDTAGGENHVVHRGAAGYAAHMRVLQDIGQLVMIVWGGGGGLYG